MTVGDRVLTAGGFLGTLTHFDPEANLARVHLAEGVEVEILPGAIRGKQMSEDEVEGGA